MTTLRKTLLSLAVTALLSPLALAGDGKYSSFLGTWDFGVSVRFDATAQQKERMKTEFEKASAIICDASDGQQEFGDVFCCNNKGGGKAAEVWILPPGTSWASNAPGRFGVSGQHIELYYDDMVFKNAANIDGSWVVAHEWGHHAYGIKDEYSGPTAGAKECVVVPAAVAERTACLIENFWNHGAAGVSLTEWCVSSNHDPNNDTWQEDINGKSCWESLVAAYPDVTAPAALPDAGPAGAAIFFDWTELEAEARFVVVIDDSGSMSSDNKMALARLGGMIFANLARDGHKLGVVRFSGSASTLYPLTSMDAGTRAAAKAAIATLTAGGSTNIDAGLSVAQGMITGAGERACAQAIVLLSDGSQGGPVAPGLIDDLVTNGIVVHSIALGPSGVDVPTMQGVAAGTGGKFFFANAGGQLPGIFAQLSAATVEGGVLNTANGTLAPGESASEPFEVDGTTSQVSFVASWDTSPADLVVSISSPNATFDENTVDPDVRFSVDESSVSVVVTGSGVVAGTWHVNLDRPGAGAPTPPGAPQINYEVQALTDSKDLTFEATADSGAYTYPHPMLVTASVTFGSSVTGIDVSGSVRRPDGSVAEFVLRDDGSAASGDVTAGDGIYSGTFSTWGDNGSYLVALDAVNTGSGEVTGGESLKPEGEVATGGEDPDDFERHNEFSVTLSGAPPLERFGLGADKFKVSFGKTDLKNKLSVSGRMNLAEDAVDPAFDTLEIRAGNLFPFTFDPEDLKQAGKKPRYVFKDKPSGTSGYVDLFKKGSSLGKFKLNDKGFLSAGFGGFGSLAFVDVELVWGDMDYEARIATKVNKKGTAASFSGKKGTYTSQELFVSSAKVGLNTKKADKDKLSVRAKMSGIFDITANDTTIAFGPWQVEILTAQWKANKKGTKHTFKSADKSTTVTYDNEKQELSISSKKQSINTITQTVQFVVTSGFFTERREIKMSSNKKGNSFVY